MGKVVKAVIATGDFEGQHAEKFLEIYDRLSGAQSLIPPAVAFLFDDEGRTETEKILERLGKDLVRFTKRRMYENHLLDTQAIAAVLNTTEGHTKQISDTDIQGLIDRCLDDPKYFRPLDKNRGVDWIRADVVLKDLFWKAAELEFRKTTHSVELTKWLIDNAPEKLKEISDAIGDALGFK